MSRNPHDALFKAVFQHPENAAAELEHILPPQLAAAVDWSSLTLEPGSYVDARLADRHSDLLFSAAAKTSHEPVLVYLLFEHQSSNDATMALRLLEYMVAIWNRFTRDHPGQALPVILPAVLAQVPGGWKAAPHFADLFGPGLGPSPPPSPTSPTPSTTSPTPTMPSCVTGLRAVRQPARETPDSVFPKRSIGLAGGPK